MPDSKKRSVEGNNALQKALDDVSRYGAICALNNNTSAKHDPIFVYPLADTLH